MEINIKGVSEVFKLIADLFSGVKKIGQASGVHRQQLVKGLGDTAELIDQTLTILKQHLTTIINHLSMDNLHEAKRMIGELGNYHEWESRYRQFQLCDPLMQAGRELDTLLNKELVNKIAFKDTPKLQQLINDYIRNEGSAGRLIGETLAELSGLAAHVDVDPIKVRQQLEKAKSEVQQWRDKFIALEKKMRKVI